MLYAVFILRDVIRVSYVQIEELFVILQHTACYFQYNSNYYGVVTIVLFVHL